MIDEDPPTTCRSVVVVVAAAIFEVVDVAKSVGKPGSVNAEQK